MAVTPVTGAGRSVLGGSVMGSPSIGRDLREMSSENFGLLPERSCRYSARYCVAAQNLVCQGLLAFALRRRRDSPMTAV